MRLSCPVRPKNLVEGRVSVSESGEHCCVKEGDRVMEDDTCDVVLRGSIRCGDQFLALTDEELDWLYLHI